MAPDTCPNCGENVPENAKACPGCGADEDTGWSEKAKYDSMGIAYDEDFDYDEVVKREFSGQQPRRKNQKIWVIAAIVLLLSFAYFLLASVAR